MACIVVLFPLLATLVTPAPGPARLVKAREAMRPLGREGRVGNWRLITDVAMGQLAGLDEVARDLPKAWAARTGLPAPSVSGEAVVIFASDTRYRRFAGADGAPAPLASAHARAGLAALVAGGDLFETRVLLVRELARLLTQRALGEKVPAWLDDGIALDLAWCRVDREGRLRPGTFDAQEKAPDGAGPPVTSGPRATVDEWLEQARLGRVPPLAALLSPGSRLFTDPGTRRDAATASGLLVRWCLADPARAARFRDLLRAAAGGGAADASTLAAALGMSAADLQRNFFEWLKTMEAPAERIEIRSPGRRMPVPSRR